MASAGLTEAELAELREIFSLVDKDGGGSISKEELGELMETLGIKATPDEIDLMVSEIDADGNGDIDFDEFVAVMSRKVNTNYSSEQIKNAFRVFELSTAPGHLKVDNLMRALTTYGSNRLTEEQAKELVSQLEPDQHGVVNFVDYVNMMMNEH